MVNMFKRSLSFPTKIPSRGAPPKPPISHHTRSISLPSRSHPLISQLRNDVAELVKYSAEPKARTPAQLVDGLTRLRQIHDSLDDFLHLPQTQDSLRRRPHYVEKVLEHFLRFVDAFGIFQTSLVALREDHSAAQVAIRRNDDSNLALYSKSRRVFAREVEKLVPSINRGRDHSNQVVSDEVVSVIDEVVEATRAVACAVFGAMYARKRSFRTSSTEGWEIEELRVVGVERLRGMRKKGEEEVRVVSMRMRDLENCIVGLECGSQRVFRGLIAARVALLNCLTQ